MFKIVIYDENGQNIGAFYIPEDASKEWVEKNIPPNIRAIQLMAGKIDKTGY